jgi:putative FmdB family regulatory protein
MIYEYECGMCDNIFEEHRKMDERNDPIACPKCESMNPKLVIGTPLFKTAGGGHKNIIR